jgi:hypothetical protein
MTTAQKVIKTKLFVGTEQAARQRVQGVPSDGLQSGQFLSIQAAL